jgi:hypothetical protein
MRRTIRSAVTAVVAAAAAMSPMLAAPSSAAPPLLLPDAHRSQTRVAPLSLPRGRAPRVLYHDQRLHVIHDGARVVPARFPGQVSALVRVVGGYLLDSERASGASTIRMVERGGRVRVLARVDNHGVLGVVSSDRRLFVCDVGVRHNRTVVMRVRDGRPIDSRRFRSGGSRVVAAGPHRALVQNGEHTCTGTSHAS